MPVLLFDNLMTSVLHLSNISKSFNGVQILDRVSLDLKPGRIHALLGENGAGKSTLMRIISGIYQPDDGAQMLLNGKSYKPASPREAIDAGVAIIHQELNLLPGLSVVENLFLGHEKTTPLRFIDKAAEFATAQKILDTLKQDISPLATVNDLSIGRRQMVEIARALLFQSDVIIMDEPTDALAERETEILFSVIRNLAAQGKAVVYISHRLGEIFTLCDDVSVLRDGAMVYSGEVASLDEETLIHHMVGRTITDQYPHVTVEKGATRLIVNNLVAAGVHDVSLSVAAGEILGFGGITGAGRTELAKAIYGANTINSGSIIIDGAVKTVKNPMQAVQAGLAYVSEDRKHEGLIQAHSISHNMTLGALWRFLKRKFFLSCSREQQAIAGYMDAFAIRAPNAAVAVSTLSGGNQQKVAIAKALMAQPRIVIFDEPTRGVDVGARREIYTMMNDLKQKGMAIILLSSDMPELLGMSDRIAVMAGGRMTGELSRARATQEAVMTLALKQPA